jgi:hypothetical protein
LEGSAVRDWSALVHHHLASVRVDDRRRGEIAAELAAHLEDAYDGALRRGCTEAEAVACAMERVPDWHALAVAVDQATDEGAMMTTHARTVLLPGTTMLLAAATGMAITLSVTPADRWADPRWYVHALAAALALLFYLVLGAIGAAWSRHAGGSPGERLAAGAFPLVLHLAVVGLGVGEDMLFALSRGGQGRHLGIHLADIPNMILPMLVAPGVALLLGVLPFARRSARLDAQ